MLQKRGKIQSQPCGLCGAEKAEKHHPDYNDPHNIEWLCRSCHLDLHRNEGRIADLARIDAAAALLGNGIYE
jgi:hypothetical protein